MRVGGCTPHPDIQHTIAHTRVIHGLHGVARQVQQHLLHHGAVAQRGRQAGLDGGVHAHPQLAGLQAHQGQDGIKQLLRMHGLAGLVAAAHKVVHALDHAARALGLAGDLAHGHAYILHGILLGGGRTGAGTGGRGMFQQVDGAVGVAGDGGQRLVEFVAEQRGHLADRGQPCGGLQTLLRGTGQLLDPAPLADVQERAHPARVLALGIDERGLDDQHGKPRAVLAHELGLKPLARRHRARKADGLALAVFLHTLGRPVGCRHAQTQQLLRAEAHHLAKGRVDVGDAALQIARAQPGHQRVLHRLAKSQRIGQVALGAQAAAVVAHQHHHHRHQRNRHGRHQGRQHIGEQAGSAVPAVHAQHQCAARQVQQVLRGKHA